MTIGRNGLGNAEELFAEPAYVRITRDSNGERKTEAVYFTQRRWDAYLKLIGAQVERARADYGKRIIDEQGLGTARFRVYNAAKNRILKLASKERRQKLVEERLPDIRRIIYEVEPAVA